jgi:hypothetical protein
MRPLEQKAEAELLDAIVADRGTSPTQLGVAVDQSHEKLMAFPAR